MRIEMVVKRIAILGAGASGLTAAKCCLDEGLVPVCFEKSDVIGGLWNCRENCKGQGGVFRSTVSIMNKEMMCYSDFPIPEEYPNFMHNKYVQKYLELYANQFDVIRHIRFRHQVQRIEQCADFQQTGQWKVKYTHCDTGVTSTDVFHGVMVCNGHHSVPHFPDFPGQSTFSGRILHTHDYVDFHGFEHKKVVIVGVGNSGCDAAVEISQHAEQVILSTRRGTWIVNREADSGVPSDIKNITRFNSMFPLPVVNIMTQRQLNKKGNYANSHGLQPEHNFLSQHPTVNDTLLNTIIEGRVTVRSNIKRINKTSIEFDDGTCEDDIDIILMATGYTFSFPFIDESILNVDNNQISLYKYVLPVKISPPTLAIIGLAQPRGAIMPISEMQSRWATLLFKGAVKAPTMTKMLCDVSVKKEMIEKRYVKSLRHTIQVDWVSYMDEIASEIGVKPNLFLIFFQDPMFAFQCFFGPCYSYQYRLMGPGKWAGAKTAIEMAMNRVFYSTRTRAKDSYTWRSIQMLKILVVIIASLIIVTCIQCLQI
ncbi:dimethylaniline monooxygenase [N-oxide-forming] 5-like isoform X2 [Anneissia japonica]|uniref:dimethylaniline monooxygenase [N-oxide-forming] 5-like isoform X2 n=1 Tax=Anneissia japonica TaxID=1529436 RepID=UPI001425906C|nr:dimethylaniline monooxygenase [N-oxide-forming] 5-like isoform X2 [Anneissia japonica]